MKQLFTAQILAIAVCLFTANHTKAQSVGINTTSPHGSAVLDVSSTTKGILVPRMTTAQRTAIDTPAIGLLVFDTDLQQFIFNVDTGWVTIQAGTAGTSSWTVSGNNQYAALGGSVGIGNNNPNALLTLGGALGFSGIDPIFTVNISNNETVLLGNEDNLHGILLGVGGNGIQGRTGAGFTTNHHLIFNPNGGYVGIGNNNPTAALDITGKTKTDSLQITAGAAAGHVLQSDSAGNATWVSHSIFPDKNWIANGQDQYAAFSGNVGVGNTNPTAKFHVTGKTKTDSLQMAVDAADGYVLQSDANGNAKWVNANTLAVSYNETDPKIAAVNNNAVQHWNGTKLVDGAIRDDSTNVGIGTAPVAANRLTIAGKTQTDSLRTIRLQITNGANNGYVLQSDATGNATWVNSTALPNGNWTTAGSNQFSAVIGNVGIGTNSPSAKLDVAGTAKVTNFQMPTGATTGYVMRSDAVGNASWVNTNTLTVNETDPQVASTTGGRVPKWSGTSLVDGIMQDDGLGIGINTAPTPATALTVNGKTSTSSLQITTGAASGYILRSNRTTGNAVWADPATIGFPETDPQVAAATANAVPRWNGTALVDGQLVDNGTNIGIGTATPGSKLDVVGTIRTTALQLTTGATNGYVLQGNAAGVATWVNPASLAITETDPKVGTLTNNLIPRWNGTSLTNTQVFDNGTATGIATTTPLSVLDVNGAMGLKVRGTLTSSSTNPDHTAGIWIYTTNSGPITLPAANTCANRMYVIANRAITPILMNPATSYIGLNGILATNIAASSAIWIVSDGSVWQQIK